MAELLGNIAEICDREDCAGQEKKMLARPPNKKRFDEEVDDINDKIKTLEDTKTKLIFQSSGDGIPSELRIIRAHKDDMFNRRKNIDKTLQKINSDIVKNNSEMTKIESMLKYKSEDRTNETIKRLEQQLEMRNFPLREERRIVNEIDALKRSKKTLVQYSSSKRVIDGMKEDARQLREEREHYHKEWTVLKQKEEKLKLQLHYDKIKIEQIKKSLNEFYEKRRTKVGEFKAQSKEYQEIQRRKQQEFYRMKKEQKDLKQENYEKELAEYEATRTPFQDEIQLCSTLMTYLHRFSTDSNSFDRYLESPGDSPRLDFDAPKQDIDGMHVLKKKNDDELFAGVKPKGKKNKREKRRTLSNKPINHTPETFEQFSKLKLSAPRSTVEVPHALKHLQQAKSEFERLQSGENPLPLSGSWNVQNYLQSLSRVSSLPSPTDAQPKVYLSLSHADLVDPDAPQSSTQIDSTSCRVDVNSIGPESAICEDSIPSTPEVQLDNTQPPFPPATSPALSLDSGTVSLENGDNNKRSVSPSNSENSTLVPESPSSRSDSIEDTRTDSLEQDSTCLDIVQDQLMILTHVDCDTEVVCGDNAAVCELSEQHSTENKPLYTGTTTPLGES